MSQASKAVPLDSTLNASPEENNQYQQELFLTGGNQSTHSGYSTPTGRAPWYKNDGTKHRPFFIGVTGGSASGKTTVTNEIVKRLGVPWVVVLSMDRFYNSLEISKDHDHTKDHNFDHPDAFDWKLFLKVLKELATGREVHVPKYSFVTHSRLAETDTLYGADVIIVEGILVLYDEKIREQLDMKIFVDTDDDIRLARRIQRDVAERGRTVDSVLFQYFKTVKPSYEQFIFPSRRHADIIIPWGESNNVAVQLMVEHIRNSMTKRGFDAVESFKASASHLKLLTENHPDAKKLPDNVKLIEQTHGIKEILTHIRDSSTSQNDFQFQINRLSRLLFAEALNSIEYDPVTVLTPTNSDFQGLKERKRLVAVSIVRGGEALEQALRQLEPDCQMGKLVIQQTESKDSGPRLFYSKLPPKLHESTVLLMDGVVATGNVLNMALEVLLDHGVLEENIVVVCLVTCLPGMLLISSRFPKIRVVTSAIDELDQDLFLTPGLGSLGKRYFGV